MSDIDLAHERWAAIQGWNGYYEVSDLGRVRSLTRVIPHPYSGYMTISGRILKDSADRKGYRNVDLRRSGVREHSKVHRLVAKAFVPGEAPGLEVCHGNSIRDDNRAVNLRWDTHAANMRDTIDHGNNPYSAETHCPSGHVYNEANTSIRAGGRRRACRICHNAAARRSRERKGMTT